MVETIPLRLRFNRVERGVMSSHLYAIGETVSLNFHEGNFFSKLDPFVIEAQMPPLGNSLQYRVKSQAEACRRVVSEHQLSLYGTQPTTDATIIITPRSDKAH